MPLLPQMKKATERKILLAIAEGDPHHFKAVEIASALGVSRAWVSAEVKDFIQAGLFVEIAGKTLSLSEKGEEEMADLVEEYRKLSSAIVSEFRLSPREARRLARSLLEGTY
jgi:DNA-binding MarR family transcriptional regulator